MNGVEGTLFRQGAGLFSAVASPTGDLWFAEETANRVIRVVR